MLNLLYCFDENYNIQASVSISSIARNIKEPVRVHIIHDNPITFDKYLKDLSNYEFLESIQVYKFQEKNHDFPNLSESHVTYATYFRLFIENYIKEDIDYLIYIDADIVCVNNPIPELLRNIEKMKALNLNVSGRAEGSEETSKEYFDNLGFKGSKYFNAGVLIINYKHWVESDMLRSLLKIMSENYEKIIFWDQDILNLYYSGKFLDLDNKLNYNLDIYKESTPQDKETVSQDIKLIHYSGNGKPWHFNNLVLESSSYYQEAYREFHKKKYHIVIKLKRHEFLNLIKLIFSSRLFKLKYPVYFIIKSVTLLISRLSKYIFQK